MARNFVRASSQVLTFAGNLGLSAPPLTLSCWFKASNLVDNQTLVSIINSGGLSHFQLMLFGAQAGDPILARAASETAGSGGITTTGYSAGVWHHACGVFVTSSERHAYIDGGSKGSDTNLRLPTGLNQSNIGALIHGAGNYCDAAIAEVAIFGRALTDAEVALLARGMSPFVVSPGNLVAYTPLWGDDPEISPVGGFQWALTNGPAYADHPPISYYAPPLWIVAGTEFTAVSDLAATAVSSSQIDLSWTDNQSGEDGYKIERSLDGSTGWTQIATTAANAVSHSDTGLAPTTTYYYRIRAFKSANNGPYSNIANATTLSPASLTFCLQEMPATLNDGLRYRFHHPDVLAKHRGRVPVFGRYSEATLEWRSVTQEDWNWMTQTVLSGAQTRRCIDATWLWNREMYLKRWGNAVIHYPESEIRDGEHKDVRLRVTHLRGESEP